MNPFEGMTSSAFDSMKPEDVLPYADSPGASNLTAMVGGLANLKSGGTENETLTQLEQTTAQARTMIDNNEERTLRYQAAADRVTAKQTALRSLKGTTSFTTPDLDQAINTTLQNNVRQDIDDQSKAALERQAVDNVSTLLTQGNTTEARVAINRMTRDRGTPLDVLRENATKRIIVQQELDKAGVDTENEGWLHWGIAGLTNLIPTNYNFSKLGNVKEGVGGYQEGMFRFFMPGSDFQKQGEALGSLTAEQLRDYMPQLIQNLRDNATTLGIRDPARVSGGLEGLFNPSPNDVITSNLFGAVDIAGAVPFGTVAKIGRVPFNLAALGARKAAGSAVAGAVESVIREGEEAAVRKTGITAAEAEDHVLPSIVNPNKLPDEPMVSLNSDVNEGLALARDVVKEMNLPATTRFVDQAELNDAVEAAKNRIRERVGTEVKDFDVKRLILADGSAVHRVEATIGGHATEEEAVNFLESRGLSSENAVGLISDVSTHELDDFTKMSRDEFVGKVEGWKKFEADVQGKDIHGLASYIAKTAPDESYRVLADKIGKKLKTLEKQGVKFNFEITDAQTLKGGTRGRFSSELNPKTQVIETNLQLRGNGHGAIPGTGYNTALHELVHAATSTELSLGKLSKFRKTTAGKNYQDLRSLFNTVRDDLLKQPGDPNHPRIVSKWWESGHNGFDNIDELLAWGLTDADMQAALKSVTLEGGETAFSKFVDTIRRLLGLDPSDNNALTKLLEISDNVLSNKNEDLFGKNLFGRAKIGPLDAFEDVSGQWYAKVNMDVPETGFYTSPLKVPDKHFLSKFWMNTSQTSDKRLFEKATSSGNRYNRMQKIIDQDLTKTFRKLDKTERMWTEQILMKGTNKSKWFSDEEFNTIYERAAGKPPSQAAKDAYLQYRVNNDIEHVVRETDVYKSLLIRGFENGRFTVQGKQFEGNVVVDYAPKTVPRERVYNLSDDIHYTTGDNALTHSRLETLNQQEYIHLKTEEAVELADGTIVQDFLMRRGDTEISELSTKQLAYKEGGHRLYAHKYFVKQGQEGIQADTGKAFLKNPNVFVTAPTVKHARDWAETMNRAVAAVKNGEDAGYLDSVVFQGRAGFPKGTEVVDKMNSGFISSDHPFEAVFDREMPSMYNNREDISKFIDEDEVGFNGYYRTTGKMYYSSKGEHLPDVTGELAPTLDPFEAQAQALNNVSRMSSFSDFKTSAIDRWVRNYRAHLSGIDDSSPANTFNAATVSRSTPISLQQQIEGQRESIKRILGFESEWDRGYRNFMRNTAEWVVGDSDSKLRQKLSEGVYWVQDNNPVNALRGFAMDMKLGMGNIGQFFLQTATMGSAIALSPTYGLKGMFAGVGVNMFLKTKGSEATLDLLSKRGLWKLGGFADEAEYKDYMRSAYRSGFFDIGNNHSLIQNFGPQSTYGTLSGGVEAARQMGRFFFNEAEVWNRTVAHRIAYGEASEKFGSAARKTDEFLEYVAGRAENYAFNMSDTSKAYWQKGLLSIPTQFWGYNVRMIEAFMGNEFTTAQKLRLAMVNLGMAGTGGLPVVAGISEYVKQQYGEEPDIDSMLGTLDRGVFDRLAYEILGADVSIGQRIGTGNWSSDLVKDVFGMSEYNDKTFADMAGGATYSITKTTLGTATELAKFWMTHESGSEAVDLTQDQWLSLAKNISTVNNFTKAYLIYNYGIYQSTKGNTIASGLPSQDAMFAAMGMNPHEVDAVSVMMAKSKNRTEVVEDLSKEINRYRQEAVARPDLFEENAKKVNALMQMVPPDLKKDVLRKTHFRTDSSLYDSLLRRKEKLEAQQEIIEGNSNG